MAIKTIIGLISVVSVGTSASLYLLYENFLDENKSLSNKESEKISKETDQNRPKSNSKPLSIKEQFEKVKLLQLKERLKSEFEIWRKDKRRNWWKGWGKSWLKEEFVKKFCPTITNTSDCDKEFENLDKELTEESLRIQRASCRHEYWFAWKYNSSVKEDEHNKCMQAKEELDKLGLEYDEWDFKNNGEIELELRIYYSSIDSNGISTPGASNGEGASYSLKKDGTITRWYEGTEYSCVDSIRVLECNENGVIKRYNSLGWYRD